MRNVKGRSLLLGILVIAISMATTDSAHAGGGKGGGKKKTRIDVQNTNAGGGRAITVWVVPDGTAQPTTKAGALAIKNRKNIEAGKTESFNVKNGSYTVAAADTAAMNMLGNNDPIPPNSYSLKTGVVVNNNVVKLQTNTPAGSSLPFKPNLN